MPLQGQFNANQFAPKQGMEKHPVGSKFPATISNTTIEPTKDKNGGMFIVEFTTPAGSIISRYNLWNNNPKAVEIAHGQLSALCHATGIFMLDWQNDGAALRNARCMIDVSLQDASDPDGYVEVKKVYDANGNEPGKARAAPQPQQPTQPQQQQPPANPPMQQQPGGGWEQAQPPQNQPAPQSNGWNVPVPSPQQQQPQQQPQQNGAPNWSGPAPGGASPPPWSGGGNG